MLKAPWRRCRLRDRTGPEPRTPPTPVSDLQSVSWYPFLANGFLLHSDIWLVVGKQRGGLWPPPTRRRGAVPCRSTNQRSTLPRPLRTASSTARSREYSRKLACRVFSPNATRSKPNSERPARPTTATRQRSLERFDWPTSKPFTPRPSFLRSRETLAEIPPGNVGLPPPLTSRSSYSSTIQTSTGRTLPKRPTCCTTLCRRTRYSWSRTIGGRSSNPSSRESSRSTTYLPGCTGGHPATANLH